MFTNRSQFSLFCLKGMFIICHSIIKPLKIKGEIVVHKNSLSHNRKHSTVNKCIILCHAAMLGMAFLIIPLRQGECLRGARGYDPASHTPQAYGHPLYFEGASVPNHEK